MLEHEDVEDLALDLEQRIDKMQHMGDDELGTFHRMDWVILVLISIIIPCLALVAVR
jgi:hypothetical protein